MMPLQSCFRAVKKPAFSQWIAAIAVPCFLLCGTLRGADKDLVGVLAIAIEQPMAKQLALTENQLTSLQEIVKKREQLGLDLHAKIKDLPPSERDEAKRAFVREAEQAGFAILNEQQRSKLKQARLAMMGMTSLSDPDVAKDLELSEGQIKQINEVLASRGDLVREVGRDKVSATMEQRLKQVLTQSQFVIWQGMAGQKIGSSSASSTVAAKVENKAEDVKAADGKGSNPPQYRLRRPTSNSRMPSSRRCSTVRWSPTLSSTSKKPLGKKCSSGLPRKLS